MLCLWGLSESAQLLDWALSEIIHGSRVKASKIHRVRESLELRYKQYSAKEAKKRRKHRA